MVRASLTRSCWADFLKDAVAPFARRPDESLAVSAPGARAAGRGLGSRGGYLRRFLKARVLLLGIACALLPVAPAQARAPAVAVSRLVRPPEADTRQCLAPAAANAPGFVSAAEGPPGVQPPSSWPRVRWRLYLWCRALLR